MFGKRRSPYMTPGIGDGLGLGADDETQRAVDQYAALPTTGGLLGSSKPASFWGGGEKFGVRDGLAGLLAVVGDAFSRQGGGHGGAVEMLAGGRNEAVERARKAQERAAELAAARQRYEAAGLDPAQADLAANGNAKYGDFKPPHNDTAADYEFWQKRLSPEQFKTWLQNRIDPLQYRQGPDGQFYPIQRATPPSITEDDWNKAAPMGGPSQPATGGFPRWR